jgi:hypothetical protein
LIAVGSAFIRPLMNIETNARDWSATVGEAAVPSLAPEPCD